MADSYVYAGAGIWRGGKRAGVFRMKVGPGGFGGGFEQLREGLPEPTSVHHVLVHPQHPERIFIGTQDGPFVSNDHGAHWTQPDFPDRDVQIWSLLVHPLLAGTLVAILAVSLLTPNGWAQDYRTPGSQRCAVEGCGGGSGGDYSFSNLFDNIGRLLSPPRAPRATPAGPSQDYVLNDRANAAYDAGDYATAESLYRQALQFAPNDKVIKSNLAGALNQEGNKAFEANDYGAAINFYRNSLQYDADATVSSNLDTANRMLDMQKNDAEEAARVEATISAMTQHITTTAAPIVSGMDFVGAGGLQPATSATAALTPVEPPTVDARNVPSGLPKFVEDNIPRTPAGDSTRRGYQEIQDHDWLAARAWFKDAMNKNPDDPGLKRLVDLAQYMVDRQNAPDPNLLTSQQIADFKVDAQYEKNTKDLVNAFIVVPQSLQSKSLDEQAKALVPGDGAQFTAGPPMDKRAAQALAHRSRVEALNFEARLDQGILADLTDPPGWTDPIDPTFVDQQAEASHLVSYAAEVEQCSCAPSEETPASRSKIDQERNAALLKIQQKNESIKDVLFLFPGESHPSAK